MRTRHGLAAIVFATVAAVSTVGAGMPGFADEATTPIDETAAPAPSPAPAPPSDGGAVADQVTVQDIEVESIQIGVANTGLNTSSSDAPPVAPGAEPTTDLATGPATAIGSSDSTAIGQGVSAVADDSSQVDVMQISIVFNIGGAVANSGSNALASDHAGGGTGDISTGSATAIGNDAATYVTQGAGATAGRDESADVRQRTATLRIGLSLANSGGNAVSAASGSAGQATARTGAATAVGNVSSTAVAQHVDVDARDGARVSVEQRATVVNFGLAFADTGSNQIGRELAAAMTATDEAAIERLLASIVPALVSGAARSGGAGDISTGDATAIGNRSTTEVLQVAVANADAGSVNITQDIVVVNAGAASATSGANAIGTALDRTLTSGSLDEQTVVLELAAFLRAFLMDIQTWASGDASELGASAMSTRLGDFDIGIDRTVAAQRTSSTSSITTRQLAAVINLAVARANSGGNSQQIEDGTSDLTAVLSTPEVERVLGTSDGVLVVAAGDSVIIVTGDASAANASVTVLCQRADMSELRCLAPPVAPPVSPPGEPGPSDEGDPDDVAGNDPVDRVSPPAASGGRPTAAPAPRAAGVRSLPATGTDPIGFVVVAMLLLLFGAGLVVIARPTR